MNRRGLLSPVLTFIVIAYAVSWAIWIGLARISGTLDVNLSFAHIRVSVGALARIPGNFGPGIAGLVVTWIYSGRAGLDRLLRRLVPSGINLRWVVFALIGPIVMIMLAVYWTEPTLTSLRDSPIVSHWLLVFVFNLPFAPLFEEIGWRGYLLPTLQDALTPASASIAVGLIWGPWHAPLYYDVVYPRSHYGVFPFLFFVLILGLSTLFSWVFNVSGGSLFVTVLLHASFNASVLAILSPVLNIFGTAPFIRLIVVVWVLGFALILATRGSLSIERIPRCECSANPARIGL
jgi:membrane protease YdiL (CAAX protease family)